MRVSSRGHYGLRAMVELAKAYGEGPVSLGQIAQAEKISLGYLEQLISKLRRAGLVESTRGAHGGYRLAVAPSLVMVGEVVRVLEGPIVPVECVSEQEDPSCCERTTDCPSREVWRRMRDSINEVLDSTSLADLCHADLPQQGVI